MQHEIVIQIGGNNIYLDRECGACDGGRKKADKAFQKKDGTCSRCNGTKFQVTSTGNAIMNLIERHAKSINEKRITKNGYL